MKSYWKNWKIVLASQAYYKIGLKIIWAEECNSGCSTELNRTYYPSWLEYLKDLCWAQLSLLCLLMTYLKAISKGDLYMYANDTPIYCIGENVDVAVAALNNALQEVQSWCIDNRLTPHPTKSEAMVFSRQAIARPLPSVLLGSSVLSYVTKCSLLGMCIDDKLNWVPHMLELKKNFSNK